MKKFIFLLVASSFVFPIFSEEEDEYSGIEEVIVTAEKREASIQDTAISITAFDESLIEGLNLRNQEDLQNFIPATTIQPYDISIRGIGRVFRALGGDPGVGTYLDGSYSEDFGIASTENALYDVARIEVLRGPQGTLYGRNSIGGAVNFISNKPTREFAAEIKTITGSDAMAEGYGFISGPITEHLSARLVFTHRMRDGTVEDLGGHEDLDSYGDENYTLALRWENDNFTADIKGNARSYGRVLASAQGAGLLNTSMYGGGTISNDLMVHGYRTVDPSVACASRVDRTVADCAVAGMDIFSFNYNGIARSGQHLVAGVDPVDSGFARPNYAYGYDQNILNQIIFGDGTGVPSLRGKHLKTATNGFNDEYFNHSAGTINLAWDVNSSLTIKYIGGYTDYLYTRITDDDRVGNPYLDEQFYAEQENENWQNELQLFWDIADNWNLTVGIFEYHNEIDQDLDFWTDTGALTSTRQSGAANYGILGATGLPTIGSPFLDWYVAGRDAGPLGLPAGTGLFGPATGSTPVVGASQTQVGIYSARDAGCGIVDLVGLVPGPEFNDPHLSSVCFLEGPWTGDAGGSASNGPVTPGTTFIWMTENKTDAYAAYFQTEYQMNDSWAITVGASWHEDQKVAQENLFLYTETALTPAGLYAYNVATGALNADGTPTGNEIIRFRGIPMSRSIHRAMSRDFEDVTWRVNFDYTPVDNILVYLSNTTGYRAGGFNLGFFSPFPTYDQEEVMSTELGYKGSHLDNTLQLNASVYKYKYENIHSQFTTASFLGGTGTSVQGFPEADTNGVEMDFIYSPSNGFLIGGNASYTDAQYSEEYIQPTGLPGVIDENNPYAPPSIYSISERVVPMKGVQMLRIPKSKVAMYSNWTRDLYGGTIDYLLTYSWTSAINWDDSGLALDNSQPFDRMDFKVSWRNADEDLEIMAFVNNIHNRIGVRNMDSDGENQGFRRSVTPTLPRSAGVSFTYKFGAY
jgi:outer membrane receptor protein involved in Fe transport